MAAASCIPVKNLSHPPSGPGPHADVSAEAHARTRAGFISTAAAFGLWGFTPLYFRAVGHVDGFQVVAHRIVWSLALVALLLSFSGRWGELRRALASPRNRIIFSITASLSGFNWLIFVWAINESRVLQVSLGYYINPLMAVLLGLLFLGERFSRMQAFALLLAAAGVINLTFAAGEFPVAGLTLASTFAAYGFLRKTAPAESLTGLALETGLLAPLAFGFLAWQHVAGTGTFGQGGLATDALLMATALVTVPPLLLFTHGARRLQLSTVGLIQYLSPSLIFLTAVLWWHEPFTSVHLVTFSLIWSALAIYAWDSLRSRRAARR